MRAIIIEEERFVEVMEAMDLVLSLMASPDHVRAALLGADARVVWKEAVESAKSKIHYQFVTWAQGHGARCVR